MQVETLALASISIFTPWWSVDRTLPWQSIWDQRVSWADRYDILTFFNREQGIPYEVVLDGQVVDTITPSEIGIYYDTETLFNQFYRATTPVNRFATSLQPIEVVPLVVNEEALDSYVTSTKESFDISAENATLTFTQNVPIITNERIGKRLDSVTIKQELTHAMSRGNHRIELHATDESPRIRAESLREVADLYSSIKDRSAITVNAGNVTHEISTNELYALIDMDLLKNDATLALSESLVSSYVTGTIAPKVATRGTPTQVVLTDGVVSSTTEGTNGSILDEADLVSKLISAFINEETTVTGTLVPASIQTVTEKRYSRSATGLTLLLQDWDAENAGEWGVALKDATDASLQATLHPDAPFVTASIYKLYVAAYVYEKIDDGTVTTGTMTGLGKTIDQCLTDMIVVSDNTCPTYFFNYFGYQNIQSYVEDHGYSATDLDNSHGGDKYTTARDTMTLLQNLRYGSLISDSSFALLRDDMSRQIYRNGIPKGVGSAGVEDKVGFLYANNHDAAYVGGDRPYTLVILSDGSNFSAIARLTERIHATMTR